jgi:ParB-like chromosome segregation protein Spo0J
MEVKCLYDSLIPVSKITPHPKNRNQHSKEQIERLAKILKYQGWRYPIKISNQTGFITSGHGRLYAAIENGWKEVPVNFQDYESDDQEYADSTSGQLVSLRGLSLISLALTPISVI